MRLLLIVSVFFISFMNVYSTELNLETDKEKSKKKEENTKDDTTLVSKNFHTLRKWKITVEYTNGTVISETITINKQSNLSAMDTAFIEAEKYVKSLNNVNNYIVSPVANNSYVLLATN